MDANMTLEELHKKTVFYGSAAAAGILLALVSSPNWTYTPSRYSLESLGTKTCLVDTSAQILVPGPDGRPVCQTRTVHASKHAR